MRIVLAAHFQLRKYGKAQVSTESKLLNGLIRLNHHVQIFSERDTAAFEAPFRWRDLGRRKANIRLLETCENFQPELLILGHCDILTNSTLAVLRRRMPALKIAYCNVDALYHEKNAARIRARAPVVDHVFLTTGGEKARALTQHRSRVSYLPNMVDAAIESGNASGKSPPQLERDLVFCGRGDPSLPRFELVRHLQKALEPNLRFETFGFDGRPAVWGVDYDRLLAGSKMGLNLNRQEGDDLCSSARVAQLMGNGVLTFIHRSTGLQRFFGERAVFFNDRNDLREKILHYHINDDERRQLAAAGRHYIHTEMSSERVAEYLIARTLGNPRGDSFPWSAC